MDYKQQIYAFEDEFFSPYAQKSAQSKGRVLQIEPCPVRTDFARDRDRIIHSKAFRRLKHKTQVFLSPEGDHYRTRLTHTLEVSQIARAIARPLRLNEDLTEAIALGHDLGHTPYGHAGERALNEFTDFKHNEQSLRIVDVLENLPKGLNLTYEVRDGILNHRSGMNPATLEGVVVAISDKIAYINHDIDDALRAGILNNSDIPKNITEQLGASHGERINTMILDIIDESFLKPYVRQSEKIRALTGELRQFLFDTVYFTSSAKAEEGKAIEMIKFLYRHYEKNPHLIPQNILNLDGDLKQHVCDYISMFSDRYAVKMFESITIPKSWDKQ